MHPGLLGSNGQGRRGAQLMFTISRFNRPGPLFCIIIMVLVSDIVYHGSCVVADIVYQVMVHVSKVLLHSNSSYDTLLLY